MRYEKHSIQYGKLAIEFRVIRRGRKTLEIAVEPDATVLPPSDVIFLAKLTFI